MSLAIIPAIKPIMIVQRMPMGVLRCQMSSALVNQSRTRPVPQSGPAHPFKGRESDSGLARRSVLYLPEHSRAARGCSKARHSARLQARVVALEMTLAASEWILQPPFRG